MKNLFLTLIGLSFFTQVYGQRLEVSIFGNATFFSYVGNDNPTINYFYGGGPPYNYNDWGSNLFGGGQASSYSAGIQTQYAAKSGFIAGLQVAYESLKSNQNLVNPDTQSPTIGHFYFQSNYVTLSPYAGYRFKTPFIKIDVMPGLDFAMDGKAHGYGNAFYGGHEYTITQAYGSIESDIRARLGVTAWYKRIGLAASYSHGLTNFENDAPGSLTPDAKTYSQVIRLGLIFRVL
jgi:hypothetical protein